jgi:uncharacterized protein
MNLPETNLEKIRKIAEQKEAENARFRSFLKGRDDEEVDEKVKWLHGEITGKIDCTQCGNCCNHLQPDLEDYEIDKLADIDNISRDEFVKNFTEKGEFENEIYLKTIPCKYLKDKKCSIYPDRPHTCKSYPHTHKPDFISRTFFMIHNYSICPIVFNVIEELKKELRFR